MSSHSSLTSGISNDAGKRKVDYNNYDWPETEVVELSAGDSETTLSRTEISGSVASGKIVDVLPSTPADSQHSFAAVEMGNASNKVLKAAKLDWNTAPSDGVKQVRGVRRKDQSPKCLSDLKPVSAHPSSNAVDVNDVTVTKVDETTTDNGNLVSDVILSGNPGIPDAPNDVTTSEMSRESDAKLDSSLPPLTVLLLEGDTATTFSADRVEPSDVSTDNVVEANDPQSDDSSTNICREIGVELIDNSEGDASCGHVSNRDADVDSDELSTADHDK